MKSSLEGWGSGLLGVIIFSGSLPATRVAVTDFSPLFLTSARAVIAATLASALLFALRQQRPHGSDMRSLAIVALGVVVGFPLLTALALQSISAARSIVFIGMLPLATAIFAVLRGGERPKPLFWLFSVAGSTIVAGYALGAGTHADLLGDGLMVAAVIVCGLGYAEGATLSRKLGGWQVISWALLFSLPVMAAIAIWTLPETWTGIAMSSWIGLGYVSLFSMLIGFVFWYRGLAIGGIASVGQLQLLQPFLGLLLAALLLHETVSPLMAVTTLAVVACVAGARKFAR
ncbi:DMT family transporter [Rhizobium sp. RU36D]|uniref:DMT family transporter n=1 Tax=Rhizobium sp. RU36D TaxID=1907415 RepID=UPI0009D84E68|nr:DMT family transporter [Rhizobium sp. RU36D]SMC68241.1 EamA-like transporter family protein [Rhizobium sp. RU36D]